MKQLKVKEYKVNICQDIEEWGREFYGAPEGAILEDKDELMSECMGFACPEDNEISIFICRFPKYRELEQTVAHELGHLMNLKLLSKSDDDQQEEKANHYENFFELVNDVLDAIYDSKEADIVCDIVKERGRKNKISIRSRC